MPTLEERIKALPPAVQQQISRFLDELERENADKAPRYLRQDWAGGLSDLNDRYTSLQLQKQAVNWWAEPD